MRINKFFKLVIAIAISELAGIISSIFTISAIPSWYETLQKPTLNPPSWVFGSVWIILYLLMGVAAFLVWSHLNISSQKRRWAIGIFGFQLVLNTLWSIIFFVLHSLGAAFIEIILLWFAIIATMVIFYRISKLAAYLFVPYIFWVSFAGYLNFSIWQLSNNLKQIVCTQEAKLCPDGSYVGRTGSNCEFAKCPEIIPPSASTPTVKVNEGQIFLREGERNGPFLLEKIYSDYVVGMNFREYPVARDQGYPVTLRIGENVSNGCTMTLTLIRIEGNVAIFGEKKDFSRPCPICLAENSLIDTPKGQIPVQDLQKGMEIWSIDRFGKRVSAIIIETAKTSVPSTHEIIYLVLNDGRKIFVSSGHPTGDGRIIGDLSIGDLLDGGRVIAVSSMSYQKDYTYDILPSGETGFYWTNGILLGSTLNHK